MSYQILVDQIISDIESGNTLPWQKDWNSQGGGIPMNLASGNSYTGVNIISTWVHNWKYQYKSNLFLTMKEIKKRDLFLKGKTGDDIRKACRIMFYAEKEREDGTKYPRPKWYNVFNIEQIEGFDQGVKEPTVHNPEDIKLATRLHKALDIEVLRGSPAYSSVRDKLYMPDLADFKSTQGYMGTMAHECVHATGHPSRLDRDMSGKFGEADYAKEELVAELGAAFICAEWGITSTVEMHTSYLEHWLKVLKEEPAYLMRSASLASKAVGYLKGRIQNWSLYEEQSSSLSDLLAYEGDMDYAA
jgi:antirestriction protein ArdC